MKLFVYVFKRFVFSLVYVTRGE